jgi:hypothetical protein
VVVVEVTRDAVRNAVGGSGVFDLGTVATTGTVVDIPKFAHCVLFAVREMGTAATMPPAVMLAADEGAEPTAAAFAAAAALAATAAVVASVKARSDPLYTAAVDWPRTPHFTMVYVVDIRGGSILLPLNAEKNGMVHDKEIIALHVDYRLRQ